MPERHARKDRPREPANADRAKIGILLSSVLSLFASICRWRPHPGAGSARPSNAARSGDTGFTLIEALVAMAILATSAVALLGATEVHIARIGDLEKRTAARWAAESHMAALRLGLPAPRETMTFGYAWTMETDRTSTSDPDLVQVTITAAPADDPRATLVRLTGFLDTGGAAP